jgi:hypothetical protein
LAARAVQISDFDADDIPDARGVRGLAVQA